MNDDIVAGSLLKYGNIEYKYRGFQAVFHDSKLRANNTEMFYSFWIK